MNESPADQSATVNEAIKSWAAERRLPDRNLERWLRFDAAGRAALLDLARELRMRTGQMMTVIDLLDEIALRGNVDAASILAADNIRAALAAGGSAPARAARLISTLRDIRFPRLARLRGDLEAAIAALNLPPQVIVRLPADLASDELVVEIHARDAAEMDRAATAIAGARDDLGRIIGRLGGDDEV
jgi:hypothetical protein